VSRTNLGEEEAISIAREIEIMESLDHPSVIKLHDVMEDDENIYMILEYMNGGTLRDRLFSEGNRKLSEKDVYTIVSPIVDAMEYCHAMGVSHRDLKVLASHPARKYPL
jgi:calcium/calmodulin-dependent protein kinase I